MVEDCGLGLWDCGLSLSATETFFWLFSGPLITYSLRVHNSMIRAAHITTRR
jgi:hypothetical protein